MPGDERENSGGFALLMRDILKRHDEHNNKITEKMEAQTVQLALLRQAVEHLPERLDALENKVNENSDALKKIKFYAGLIGGGFALIAIPTFEWVIKIIGGQ